jgi:hypothetical protein
VTARTVVAPPGSWLFTPDDPPHIAERTQAILRARIVDEVTGEPPAAPLQTATTLRGAVAQSSGGGRVGVVGRPRLAFPDAGIALAHADLTVAALGFLPLQLDSAMGPQPGYPDAFTPPDLLDVGLHRAPTRISGRVVSRSAGPLAGASVQVNGVWPLLDAITGPPAPANAMAILSGVYADRPVGATLRRRNFTLAPQVKQLVKPVVAGATTLIASDRQAIAASQVLAIEPGDPERIEFIGIAAIDTGSSADQPALITLDHPVRRDHAERAVCVRAVAGAAGAANALTRAARAGDFTAWTAGLAGIGTTTTSLEISGSGPPTEYHSTARYQTATSPAGDYRLPPIHRIAHVRMRVAHPSQPNPIVRAVTLEWGRTDLVADFLFP